MASLAFNESAWIGERAAKSNMIINKDIPGTGNDIADEHSGSHQSVPAISLGMTNFVRLYDRARCDPGIKALRENLSHGIGNRVKAANFIGGNANQNGAFPCQKTCEPFCPFHRKQVSHETVCGFRISGFRGGIGRMCVTGT